MKFWVRVQLFTFSALCRSKNQLPLQFFAFRDSIGTESLGASLNKKNYTWYVTIQEISTFRFLFLASCNVYKLVQKTIPQKMADEERFQRYVVFTMSLCELKS